MKTTRRLMIFSIILSMIFGILIGKYTTHPTVNEKKPLYWIDSMEPTIHYKAPGKSRMGMELSPVYLDKESHQSGVHISPDVINNMGVRTITAQRSTFARRIEAVGYIEPNENKINHIHSYSDGWIKKLYVNSVGAPVKKGQVLLQLYSPMLINAQEEYLIALNSRDQELVDASIKKMQALHIPEKQIQQLKKIKKSNQLVDIDSPQEGVVTALNVREGMRVTPDTEIMSLVDLSSVWIIAQVFEDQAKWVNVGERSEIRLSAFPNRVWKGEVEYIYPQVDPTTRTIKVRFRFSNPDYILKPNMYANVALLAEQKANVLRIPLEALIRSSKGNRVIVSSGNGHFEVHSIMTGMESGDQVEILSGLHAGERVVTSGQFLIDSEANLKAGLERVATQPATPKVVIAGKGTIKALNVSQSSLTLQHEPIPVLNWPEMTMDFSVEKEIDLKKFKINDYIKFTLKKDKDNKYIITGIQTSTP